MSRERTHIQYSYLFISLIKYNNFTMIFLAFMRNTRDSLFQTCSGNSNTLTYFIDKKLLHLFFLDELKCNNLNY